MISDPSIETSRWKITRIAAGDLIDRLAAELDKISVPFIPIKGAHLVRSGLAFSMNSRRMDDIDLLISPCHIDLATAHFFSLPWCKPLTDYKESHKRSETQFMAYDDGFSMLVELHSELNFPQRFHLPVELLFSRSTAIGEVEHWLIPEDALLIFGCHLMTHIALEFRETNIEEMKILSSVDGFSWIRFFEIAQPTSVSGFFSLLLLTFAGICPEGIPISSNIIIKSIAFIWRKVGWNNLPMLFRRIFFEWIFYKSPTGMLLRKIRNGSSLVLCSRRLSATRCK